ncbi:endoplasmic reticulum protein [Mycena olivaceomarginata]|nr:endoplasmic reticulum protein [Mycena olivaceomarginata]
MSKSLEYSTLESASNKLTSNVRWRNLPPPPGFSKSTSVSSTLRLFNLPSHIQRAAPHKKRAMDFATAPAKSLPMQRSCCTMSGGGVCRYSAWGSSSCYSSRPFKNLAGINDGSRLRQAKNPKALTTLILQKLVYVACNLLTLGVGLWKVPIHGATSVGDDDPVTPTNAANLRIPTDWSVPYPRPHICVFPRGSSAQWDSCGW